MFDSGLGGLAVLRELRLLLPREDVLYVGDTARQPYGPQPAEDVRRYTVEIIGYLVRQGVKLVIIACNSASVAGSEAAQRRFPDVPMLGMIQPGVRAAVRASKGRRLGVWGTSITVASRVYDRLLREARPGVEVLGARCSELLRLAEKGHIEDRPRLRLLAEQYFRPLADFGVDTLLLGCTDLTCVRDVVEEVVGEGVIVVDPAREAALEAARLLEARRLLRPSDAPPANTRFLITGDGTAEFTRFAASFLGLAEVDVARVDLDTA
jgi:glutamate racemase